MSQGAETIVITGIGMITPVGRTAYETCASIRADISRITDIDYFEYENDWFELIPLKGAPIYGVTDGFVGRGRFSRLAVSAINDLFSSRELEQSGLSETGLYTGLPIAGREGTVLDFQIGKRSSFLWKESIERTYSDGHASCAKALVDAVADLQEGTLKHAVVGGVDSLVEESTLDQLHKAGRLITEDNPDGFFPGEAAAFFMLETLEYAQERGAHIYATLEAPAFAIESETVFSDVPSTTQGLRTAIRTTLEGLEDKGENTGLMVCDLNGETYRAKEFGTVIPAVFSDFKESWKVVHPAELMGDVGAASFAVSVCLAARALEHGYAGTDNVLVWGGSDNGLRGSVYLRKYES